MSRNKKSRSLFPVQFLNQQTLLLGECVIGPEPKKRAAAKRIEYMLGGNGLVFKDLKRLSVRHGVISELYRLVQPTRAPEFKARPKLVAAPHGRQRWADLFTVNGGTA